MASREYKLRSPGNPGGLVPLAGQEADAPNPPDAFGEMLSAVTGIPLKDVTPPSAVVRFAAGLPSTLPSCPIHQPSPPSPPSRKGGPPLSQAQKATLGSMSAAAFAAAVAADPDWLPDMKSQGHTKSAVMEDWRHSQCALATAGHPAGQIRGLSKAGNEHYNALLAHFAALAGQDMASFNATIRDTPATAAGDTADKMRQALWRLDQTMKKTGLGWPYVMAIVKRKHHATAVDQLTAGQIHQLCWTLNNRKAQKRHAEDGTGNGPESRNKAQTAKRSAVRGQKSDGLLPDELPANVTTHDFAARNPF